VSNIFSRSEGENKPIGTAFSQKMSVLPFRPENTRVALSSFVFIQWVKDKLACKRGVIMAGGPPKRKAYHLLQENKSTYGIIE
jgi:hypothetical protein